MGALLDVTGQKFGRLTATERLRNPRGKGWVWRCRCECGNERLVPVGCLRSGNTRSCGCLQRDTIGNLRRGHGGSIRGPNGRHPLYYSWLGMRNRCNNPRHKRYADYGGRGIKVDPSWDDFEQFARDVGERPSPEHSLDRFNNDGDYEPGNVRWATPREQVANQRPRANKTGFAGVSRKVTSYGRERFTACVRVNGTRRSLGSYDSAEEAGAVVQSKKAALQITEGDF